MSLSTTALEAEGSDEGYSFLPNAQAHGDSAALPNGKLSSVMDHGEVSRNMSHPTRSKTRTYNSAHTTDKKLC